MMFRPRESHDLRLISARLEIMPEPAQVRWVHDVFDNSVAVATFAGKTTELRFDSAVTLEHIETALPDYTASSPRRRPIPSPMPATTSRASPWRCGGITPNWTSAAGRRASLAPAASTGTIDLLRRDDDRHPRAVDLCSPAWSAAIQTPSETLEQRQRPRAATLAVLMIEGVPGAWPSGAGSSADTSSRPEADATRCPGGGARPTPGFQEAICRARDGSMSTRPTALSATTTSSGSRLPGSPRRPCRCGAAISAPPPRFSAWRLQYSSCEGTRPA